MCASVRVWWQKLHFEQTGSICSLQELWARLLVSFCLCLWVDESLTVCASMCVCVRDTIDCWSSDLQHTVRKQKQTHCSVLLILEATSRRCFFVSATVLLLWLMDWRLGFSFLERNQLAFDETLMKHWLIFYKSFIFSLWELLNMQQIKLNSHINETSVCQFSSK